MWDFRSFLASNFEDLKIEKLLLVSQHRRLDDKVEKCGHKGADGFFVTEKHNGNAGYVSAKPDNEFLSGKTGNPLGVCCGYLLYKKHVVHARAFVALEKIQVDGTLLNRDLSVP